jgi:hypothetical protein
VAVVWLTVVVSSLLLVLSAAGPARALDLGEWLPGLKLSPFFTQRVEYETNVFQVPSGSQDDVVFKMIPGFVADYSFGPHSISAGYRAEILKWLDLTSEDTVHHIGVAQLRLDFPRLLVNVRDDFTRTSDPPNSELVGRILSNTNVLAPEAEYRLSPRFSLGANYAWTHVSFDDRAVGEDLDRDEHLIGASVFYKVLPKADLRLSYDYGIKRFRFQSDRDVSRHLLLVAVRGDITSKLSSTFRIGVERRDPDSSFQPGYTGLIMGGDWIYRPTDRTMLTLTTDRSVNESTFGDVPYYVTTSMAVGVQQQLWRKVTVSAKGTVGRNEYPNKQTLLGKTDWRDDFFYAYGVGADYEIQPWISVGVEYTHTARRSNFDTFDFSDDKFTVKASLQF